MRIRTHLTTVVAALLLAVPAAADDPFGRLGGIVGGVNAGTGVLPIHGWALDDDGIRAVDILVDGVVVGRARYGASRPGVARLHPGFPDSANAGFGFQLDSTHFVNGLHEVTAAFRSETGEVTISNPVTLQFTNTTNLLRPFGRIELPNRNAVLSGRCDLTDPFRRYSVIQGWALDSGVELGDENVPPDQNDPEGDAGVFNVQLFIDGALYADSIVDCHFDDDKGGLTDCYGLRRLDIEERFPTLPDGPTAGFRFVLDVGALIDLDAEGKPTRYVPGKHVLKVRSTDVAGQAADIHQIPVTFTCDEFIGNEASFGRVADPREGQIVSGVVRFVGWALDFEGVLRIEVYVDGEFAGLATHGLPRKGVTALYPGYPDSAGPGWRIFLDTEELSDGVHHLQVIVVDHDREETLIGERTFHVDNTDL